MGYTFTFTNVPGAHPIDYVDVGLPSWRFNENEIEAQANGQSVRVSTSDYQGSGSGVAIVMGSQTIQPGQTGTVTVWVPRLDPWLQEDSSDSNYASFVVSPTWFGRQYMQGTTDMSVTVHLPPGVKPEEPRWHTPPSGFPAQPETGIDDQGRITYTWSNAQAAGWQENEFGLSFPAQYVPAAAITRPSFWERTGIDPDALLTCSVCSGILLLTGFGTFMSARSARRRKLQYLPPKIAIEGLGIKRGLTAVEAAVLMEQPLDKVLTMILFGILKKDAAQVTKQTPLAIQAASPLPEGLYEYEKDFLEAFTGDPKERRKKLQTLMVSLATSVSGKMKGFSRKESVAYYKDITERAWKQVEAAQTPEVKGEKFDEVMEWTMLDKDYDGRTREVFTGPVMPPIWWWRYDPGFPRPAAPSAGSLSGPAAPAPSAPGKSFSMPTLPGSTFAASIVNGVQNFAGGVIGDLTEFTTGVTSKTNPFPVATSANRSTWKSGGGGGGRSCACACACACAGCACACAGGGR
jgi:hypothetical protein